MFGNQGKCLPEIFSLRVHCVMAIDFISVVWDPVLVSSGAISVMQALPERALGLAFRKITSRQIGFYQLPDHAGGRGDTTYRYERLV